MVLIAISFLFFSFFSPISPVSASGINITFTNYWFYILEPTTIDFEELSFSVKNILEEPVEIKAGYDRIEGINVSVNLAWTSIILQPDASISNHFFINVQETYNTTFPVQISVVAHTLNDTGNKLVGGGIITNHITYYSQDSGYFLELFIVDQSGEPRVSDIKLEHKFNTSYPYSPIKRVKDDNIRGYFPQGYYSVLARDVETNRTGEAQFYLGNNSEIHVEVQLVGFKQFEPIQDNENHLGINATINNYVSLLYEVEIFAELYSPEGKLLDTTTKDYWQEFPQVQDHRIEFWFDFKSWEVGRYEVFGRIYSLGEEIAYKFKFIDISDVIPVNQGIPTEIMIIMAFIGGVSLTVFIIKFDKTQVQKTYAKLQELYHKRLNK